MQEQERYDSGPGDWVAHRGVPGQGKAEMIRGGAEAEPSPQVGAVGVSVAAQAGMLPMLRSVVETVLLTADFTLDVVTDMRVAIDEVATAFVMASALGSEIACELRYDRRRIEVEISGLTRSRVLLRGDSLSRKLLESVTDELDIGEGTGRADTYSYLTVVRFSRRRSRREG
ncbi:anti-sigma factor [Nocardia sp. CDC160]|uniref:anti-sigma factor n=1 Tax=Nocardia sp. CDC160 TaxID=3112166 RepID=UPI002DBBC95A|nr:anti-sigma factor [Nocardia sp. CDC160]MEC3916820.1 anti-sigma factor [Nocardia sp. CDC160]